MIAQKHITKIIAVVMALVVCLCLGAVVFSDQISELVDPGVSMEYETALFDTDSIMSVNIIMDEDDWNDMLENAMDEEYHQCDVEINGTTFYKVGIRPKGNTSLSSIANDPTTDRYSFKLEFDHYVEGQTCFGLDKLILNNNYADATNMKEALVYDMYEYLGADASLYNYAKISVNGDYWGVYLALEAVEDSFQLRNYGTENGNLYKPESMDMGGAHGDDDNGGPHGKDGDMQPPDFGNHAADADNADGQQQGFSPPQMPGADGDTADGSGHPEPPGGGDGGFTMSSGGADLNYIDDDLDSYSTIWDGEITKTKKADHKRVVKALKNIDEGTDLEQYMDIDNLLRYMAVHVFSVNEDSLSGNMAHNYYLYETNGRLNLIPWDYNLAFGGMGGGMGGGSSATSMVNDAIDNAFSATDFFDTLMENETYYNQYHAYLQQLVDEYVNGGGFDRFYERVRSQIDALVETDPTAFYTYDEYQTAAETLYQVVKLRGESIEGQLNGSIPSTAEEQKTSDALVDASSIDLTVMGTMMNGGGPGDGEGGPGEPPSPMGNDANSAAEQADAPAAPAQGENAPADAQNVSADDTADTDTADQPSPADGENGRPQMGNPPGGNASTSQTSTADTLLLYGCAVLLLLIALLFAVRYKRKPRR